MISTDDSVKERIKFFKFVRDIPYHISISGEQEYCCSQKSEMLEKLLSTLGIKSRQMLCQFRWESLNLPEEILQFYHEDPEYHQFLEVYVPKTGKWVFIDPTWNSGLKNAFEINEWDGINETKLAVPAIKIFSPEESMELIKKLDNPEEMKIYLEKNREFFIALNKYLKEVRT